MKIKRFNEAIKTEMDYFEAFKQFIKGNKVIEDISIPAYGDYSLPANERYYGDGIIVEGDYKMISHGGGCSGEDCNISFILSPDNEIIAKRYW